MRTRSYQQSYISGDLAMSCICGYYGVIRQTSSSQISPYFREQVSSADSDIYRWKRCCPKCQNTKFIEAKTHVLDYISCFDNLATIRLVAQFSTYCHVKSQKAFRRTTHRFSICYNKKTGEAHLKFKGKICQVNRILRQTNKGHIGKLDDMLRAVITDPEYRGKVCEFKRLVAIHAGLDPVFHYEGLATLICIRGIQNVLTRAYYQTVNNLRCFRGHNFINSDIPKEVMKVFRIESSTYKALSKISGIKVSKPIYKEIDTMRQFYGLVLASRMTKNPDLILKLLKSGYCHDNYYPGEHVIEQLADYVEHIGQANIDNAIKFSKVEVNIIAYVRDTLRLIRIIERKHIPLPVFHSFLQYHDDLAYINRTVINAPVEHSFLTSELIPIESTQGGYTFKVCRDTSTLRRIGEDLHSCVASYQSQVDRGHTIIIDMQLEGKSYCCIEYNVERMSLVQAKKNQAGPQRGKPDKKTVEIIEEWVDQIGASISPHCRDLVEIDYHCDYQHGGYVNVADHHQLLDYEGRRRARLVGMHEAHAGNYMIQGQAAHEMAEQQIRAYREAYPDGLQFIGVDIAAGPDEAVEQVIGVQPNDEYAVIANDAIDALLEDE